MNRNKITIDRKWFTTKATMGILRVPDAGFECYTLEDVARPLGVKIYGETAIPQGEHKFILNMSSRFKRLLPLIYNTPNYTLTDGYGAQWTGIRIHGGNTSDDTHGCILLGYKRGDNNLYESKKALEDFMDIMKAQCEPGKEYLVKISNEQSASTLYV